MNKLKAKIALKWLKYIDVDTLLHYANDQRIRKGLDSWYGKLNKRMLDAYYKEDKE